MTIIFAAATVPINPAGASPKLTMEQIWAGLELKARQPQLFLAVIDTCEVLEDKPGNVLRQVKFKDGGGNGQAPVVGPTVQERITHIAPLTPTAGSGIETFAMVGAASKVLNIVSTGESPEDLYLTYTFEWEHKEVEAGSEEEKQKQKQYQANAPKAVAGTIAAMRNLVKEGKL